MKNPTKVTPTRSDLVAAIRYLSRRVRELDARLDEALDAIESLEGRANDIDVALEALEDGQ